MSIEQRQWEVWTRGAIDPFLIAADDLPKFGAYIAKQRLRWVLRHDRTQVRGNAANRGVTMDQIHIQNCPTCDGFAQNIAGEERRAWRSVRPGADQPRSEAVQSSHTAQLLGYLSESQNNTHDRLSTLEKALESVLMPAPPQTDKAAGVNATAQSPLCEELDRRVSVEHAATSRIQGLIDRLTI